MKRLGFLLSALALGMALGCGGKRAEPAKLDHEMITALGQAATVKIYSYGDITLTGPYDVKLRSSTRYDSLTFQPTTTFVLNNRVSEDRSKGLVPDGMSEAEYAFRVLSKSPDDFLEPTSQTDDMKLEDRQYSEGSGVVVDSSGIILTNKHVVSGGEMPAGDIAIAVARVVVGDIEKNFYYPPTAETRQATIFAVAQWLQPQIHANVTFKSARVLFPRKRASEDLPEREEVGEASFAELFPTHEQAIMNNTSEATVLASGEVYPGKDVAVLKVDEKNLIAIQLGDSSQLSAGANVYCFGFPGAALDQGMTAKASYLCINHDGRVGQIMPMSGDWGLIHMTADINHGDSGGPVLDDHGNLIGLNVAGKEDAPGQNYAIPVAVAKEFLKQAGIDPKPGEVSQNWREALLDYYSNDMAAAFDKLTDVDRKINGPDKTLMGSPISANRYVEEKLTQAKQAAKK